MVKYYDLLLYNMCLEVKIIVEYKVCLLLNKEAVSFYAEMQIAQITALVQPYVCKHTHQILGNFL